MDLSTELVRAWRINAGLNLMLLDSLTPEQLAAPLTKGKAVSGQFSHIHSVRLMWLKAIDPVAAEAIPKIEDKEPTAEDLRTHLNQSTEAIASVLAASAASGKVKNFTGGPVVFCNYLTAHEAFHRAQAELALRQAGIPLDQKLEYGLWQWTDKVI